jgi:choline dehydrogenase-like flavoprotein
LKIDWSVTSADTSQIFSAMKEFQSNWAKSGLSKRCSFVLFDRNRVLQTISNTGGTLHPSGLMKIGTNSELDDLDLNLKVHGTRNLYCLSSGVLPTITTVNPVMTTLLLGCKLSEKLLDKK